MKKLYFVFILFMFSNINIKAQGNLQFNKVKLLGAISDTVPVGKTWKIESILPTRDPNSVTIYINNQVVYISQFVTQTFSSSSGTPGGIAMEDIHNTKLPFWLPEGSSISCPTGFISIIEFNIIQ